jgi:two-component system, sensor histidine kinase ChiS
MCAAPAMFRMRRSRSRLPEQPFDCEVTVVMPTQKVFGSDPTSSPDPTAPPSTGILVVDDEPAVLKYICLILRRQGYRVLAAGNAHEAIQRIESGESIDLLLADFHLPGLSGLKVAAEFRRTHPGAPVLIASGAPINETLPSGFSTLLKPFTPRLLYEQVRGALLSKTLSARAANDAINGSAASLPAVHETKSARPMDL